MDQDDSTPASPAPVAAVEGIGPSTGTMSGQFSWIPFYEEVATLLATWRTRQKDLLAFLEKCRADGLKITPLIDKDAQGARLPLDEIDPFTFLGTFNRGIREDERIRIISSVRGFLGVASQVPTDFDGIPLLNNQKSWFIAYRSEREATDVDRLWTVFEQALQKDPLGAPEFLSAFDDALNVKSTNINLTIGLFWIRPRVFLSLDQMNRQYLGIKLPPAGLSGAFYVDQVKQVASQGKPFVEVSRDAWRLRDQPPQAPSLTVGRAGETLSENNFWMVGAYWSESDPPDQTARCLDEGIWENGYEDQLLDEVRSMRVGDRIAIKAATTQRHNLPFDARGRTVSRMTIKAIGTIVGNRGDGRVVEVEWEPQFKPRDWYFYTQRGTVWLLRRDNEFARRLIDFAFGNSPQDYAWFIDRLWGAEAGKQKLPAETKELEIIAPYALADIFAEGVFLEEAELQRALDRLHSKKNVILQGPPGVGKTWLARKLAYAFMEGQDDTKIQTVQFHQSYSYEDFVRGYRPSADAPGSFKLKDGPFIHFCQEATKQPDYPYVFIIDEINRGNLSQIFGELLMLIEADKRGARNAVRLAYPRPKEDNFFVPENVHILGLMNLADRSLAMVDYALRRRFAFITLAPQFASPRFRDWLLDRGMDEGLVNLIIERLTALNENIGNDSTLGPRYAVGHSFFCPRGDNFAGLDRQWYNDVIETEIAPLLEEYWFDDVAKASEAKARLLAP